MVAVSTVDGIKYGFKLLGYLLAVAIAGGLLILIGTGFSPGPYSRGNPILVVVFAVAGLAVIYAGGLGMLYKVIADGVQVGTIAAERGGPVGSDVHGFGGGGQRPAGQPPAGQPAQGGNHQQGGHAGQPPQDTDGQEQVGDERPASVDEDRSGN